MYRVYAELYDTNELTSAINRVVEDQTHRFTVEVLTRDFKSNDLALSARNLRRDRAQPNDVLDRVDAKSVTQRLMELLEIRNRSEQTVALEPAHAAEIREYLALLDLTQNVDIVTMPSGEKLPRTVIAQPGLRYAQAKALIESLLFDPAFSDLSITERNSVQERILSGIMGRMMEDAVLLETKLANPKKQVFVLQFAVGEFDMVQAHTLADEVGEFVGRDLSQAFEPGDLDSGLEPLDGLLLLYLVVAIDIVFLVAYPEEGSLEDVDVAAADEVGVVLHKEGEHEHADVHAVVIGIGGDHYAVVAEILEIVFDSEGRDQEVELFVLGHFPAALLVTVDGLSPQ